MADSFVQSVVSILLERTTDLLIGEVNFLRGVADQVRILQDELQWIHAFLEDADAVREKEGDKRLQDLLSKFRDIAYDAEDAIDTFILKVASARNRGGFRERHPTYGVQNIAGTSTNDRRPRLGGIGGSGKTTLARKLYNHVDIKKHFDCHAWVSISQEWRARDLLINVITQTTSPSNENRELIQKMSNEELVTKVHYFLKEKIYLLVLDDVWENEAWDELRPALPSENLGSKLIITTRIRNVALLADPNCFVHTPRSLTDEEAWELLLKNVKGVIKDDRREEASRFHELGKEMVKKSSGLPLAIVVLGGLLATKTSLEEWEKVGQNIGMQLRKASEGGTQQYGEVLKVLAMSYDNLPYYLKPCFLYLGMFPEDSEIRVKPLIRMWIAEGFISSPQIDREETLEHAGKEYLQELIQRSLIQVVEKDTTGRPKSCLMHDLLRDLCLEKAREESFFEVLSSSKSTIATATQGSISKARRIAVHFGDDADSTKCTLLGLKISSVRSLLCFGSEFELSKSEWKIVCTNLPLLGVLHLQVLSFICFNLSGDCRLPKQIGNLYHLKYLGLANRNHLEIPQSLGNLRSLQTLDIGRSSLGGSLFLFISCYAGGEVVQKMEQLRYLHFSSIWINSRDFGVGGLKNLQCLKNVEAGDWIARGGAVAATTPTKPYQAILAVVPTERARSHGSPREASLLEVPNAYLKCIHGDPMTCSANGFPQLQHLKIECLEEREEWIVEEGAMPHLKHLKIEQCEKLRMIPEGLKFITILQELKIEDMPKEFEERVRKVDSRDAEATKRPTPWSGLLQDSAHSLREYNEFPKNS
ncbi:NB-ARC [Dillenia turbinata]|uniref:NB-ARC n=1 Tax=Dillenia turbinata TaxID=194707 RepID=A0AAN8WAV1_9MAGN